MRRNSGLGRRRAAAVYASVGMSLVGIGRAADATPLSNVQAWYGSGPNQAGLEIDWKDGTANHTVAFGYRWSGSATGEQMFNAVVAGDPRLYAEVSGQTSYGTAVFGIGFDAVTDRPFGQTLSPTLSFNAAHLAYTDYDGVDDARAATGAGDQWQEGWYNAGYWAYYESTDARLAANSADWSYGSTGISQRTLTNGDWDGFSFSYDFEDAPPSVPAYPAPAQVPEPAGAAGLAVPGMVLARRRRRAAVAAGAVAVAGVAAKPTVAAYTYNPTDFATAVVGYAGTSDSRAAYNVPSAILDQPPLTFNNSTNPNVQDIHLSKIVEPPYNYGPGTTVTRQPLLLVLPAASSANPNGSSVTVQMGRPVTHDPGHPYGDDLIVYGNSFYTGGGGSSGGFVSDSTNLNGFTVGGVYGHPVQVSVSPDDATWFSFPVTPTLMPYQSYRWDPTAAAYTGDVLNPTVPLSPATLATNFAGQSAAAVLAAYGDSAGGTPFDISAAVDAAGRTLAQDGFSAIDYVRLTSTSGDYAVISGVAAVSVPEPAGVAAVAAAGLLLGRRRR